jgi:hypothetical protein
MKNTEPTTWKTLLWMELDSMQHEEQFATTGEWITYITQTLLPALGVRRRESVMNIMERDGSTAADVAAVLGKRTSTVIRLIDEGRSARKVQRAAERIVEEQQAATAA